MTVPEDLKNQLEELGIDMSEAILAYLRGLVERAKKVEDAQVHRGACRILGEQRDPDWNDRGTLERG